MRNPPFQLKNGRHLTVARQNYTTSELIRCVIGEIVHPASQLSVFLHDAAQNRLQVVVFLSDLSTLGQQSSNSFFHLHSFAVRRDTK